MSNTFPSIMWGSINSDIIIHYNTENYQSKNNWFIYIMMKKWVIRKYILFIIFICLIRIYLYTNSLSKKTGI